MRIAQILLMVAASWAVGSSALGADAKPSMGGPPTVLNRIFSHWKTHQQQIKSFHFRARDKITLLKGSIEDFRRPQPGKIFRQQHDQAYYSDVEIWVQGDSQLRYDVHQWSTREETEQPAKDVLIDRETFDGQLLSAFHKFPPVAGLSSPPRAWSRAWIERASTREVPEVVLSLCFRILRPPSSWSVEQCRLITKNAIVDGRRWIEVERREPIPQTNRTHNTRCWIDGSRDDVIVAWEEWRGASNWRTWSGSIDYQHDKQYGWIPSHWKLQFNGPQSRIIESTVSSYQINEKYPPKLFTPEFPTGTAVRDAPTGQSYVIQPDGSKRLITSEELERRWQGE